MSEKLWQNLKNGVLENEEFFKIVNILSEYSDFNINYQSQNGQNSFMHFAAQHGDLELATYLVDKGIDINLCNIKGRNSLFSAAKGLNDSKDEDERNDSFNMIRWLIENGCNKKQRDEDGITAWQYARSVNEHEASKLLSYLPILDGHPNAEVLSKPVNATRMPELRESKKSPPLDRPKTSTSSKNKKPNAKIANQILDDIDKNKRFMTKQEAELLTHYVDKLTANQKVRFAYALCSGVDGNFDFNDFYKAAELIQNKYPAEKFRAALLRYIEKSLENSGGSVRSSIGGVHQ